MNDAFTQLMEHALREELGPRPLFRDLAAAVATALAAGQRIDVPGPVAAMRRSRWRRLAPLAAVFAAAAVVVAVLLERNDRRVATADRDLLVTDVAGTFTAGTRMVAGAAAWCTGTLPVGLVFANGSAGSAVPGSVFALSRSGDVNAVELIGGAFELRAPGPFRLSCALAEVELAPGGAIRCELNPSAPATRDPGDPPMNLAALRSRLSSATAVFTVSVLAGTADLVTAQGRETVPAGQSRRVAAPDPAAATRAEKLYQAVRTELPPPNDEATMVAWKQMDEKLRELSLLVLRQPAAMAAIQKPLVHDLADTKLGGETRARLVALALLDEDKHTFAAVIQVWTSLVDASNQLDEMLFPFEQQVALAERGFALASAKLKEFLREPAGTLSARAAAALAFGGDGSMREVLKPWNEVTLETAAEDFQQFDARCQAALGLGALGDREAVPALRTFARDVVERLLAAGDPQQTAQAASFLQRARYYFGSPKPRLGELDLRIDANADAGLGDGTDAAKVRAALQKFAPK